MAQKECCRSCRHGLSSHKETALFCRLRKLNVHSELATFVFCHHWTKKSPSLPDLDEKQSQIARQLDFERALVSKET